MDCRQNNGSVKVVSPHHCPATTALRNCCLGKVTKHVLQSHKACATKSQSMCYKVTKHVLQSHKACATKSQSMCYKVTKHVLQSHKACATKSQSMCYKVTKHVLLSSNCLTEGVQWKTRRLQTVFNLLV